MSDNGFSVGQYAPPDQPTTLGVDISCLSLPYQTVCHAQEPSKCCDPRRSVRIRERHDGDQVVVAPFRHDIAGRLVRLRAQPGLGRALGASDVVARVLDQRRGGAPGYTRDTQDFADVGA